VQPSSLIFLVLIAIWAAYLLQHWVRRREHLATARSVDRFSEAMRVLERRSPLSEFDLSAPRSYALSPARPSRQEVVVKRAQSPDNVVPPAPATAVRSTRIFHLLAGVSARRARGVSFIGSLALVLVVSPLAAFSLLPWWSAVLAFAVLAADVGWLHRVAVSERARSRAPERARRSAEAADQARAVHSAESAAGRESQSGPGPESERKAEPEPEPERGVPGQVAAEAKAAEPVSPPVEVDPSAWAPVPVPPPTYTLKARAADPVPLPAVVPELGASECWSLDGMVYDCDLDELVENRSATGA
jgi:membrane protein implicated in regulation of membrane protease activity